MIANIFEKAETYKDVKYYFIIEFGDLRGIDLYKQNVGTYEPYKATRIVSDIFNSKKSDIRKKFIETFGFIRGLKCFKKYYAY